MSSRLPTTTPPRSPKPSTNTNTTVRSSPLYRQRRSIVWAVGIAATVTAGALIGATLKTRKQDTEKKVEIQKSTVDVSTQVALLETRRAALQREKSSLESKIEMLRERQRRNEDLERQRQAQRQSESVGVK